MCSWYCAVLSSLRLVEKFRVVEIDENSIILTGDTTVLTVDQRRYTAAAFVVVVSVAEAAATTTPALEYVFVNIIMVIIVEVFLFAASE